jgi:hypothetical protein
MGGDHSMEHTIKTKEHEHLNRKDFRRWFEHRTYGLLVRTAALLCSLILTLSPAAEAFFYHATRRAAAKRIMARGLNPAKFKAGARFGKGLYLSRKIPTTLAEKGKKSTVIRMKPSRYLEKNILDLRNPTRKKLRSLFGPKINLRGRLKKWIIGPKLGRRLGTIAGKKGKVIQYRSVKTGGTNLIVPKRLIKGRPKIVQPMKIVR